ncbi:hypothetical protein EV426DRAFT_161329 [Tirmania nivea]|nr:hypothetical protein EV426DRAFT_161329 [Tirmania nivea]
MPPSRVTRSATRLSSDQSNANNSTNITNNSNTTTTTVPLPTTALSSTRATKKRKSQDQLSAEIAPTNSVPKRKRTKSQTELPQHEEPASPAKSKRRKGKAAATASGSGPAREHNTQPEPVGPSKRRSTRNQRTTENTSPSTIRRSCRMSGINQPDPDTAMPDVTEKPEDERSEADEHDQELAEQALRDAENAMDEDGDDYDRDDDDDGFNERYLGGAGGLFAPGFRSNGMVSISGLSPRLREILNQIRQRDDPTIQMLALQQLAEILLICTEDNLSGHFSPDQFIKELVSIMRDPSPTGMENPEMMLLACRCISNIMEALPAAVSNVVFCGAVPVLCQKLLEISYIDLAEQALSTLEKISVEYPSSIVREGGLTACLSFLDFFATNVQRTAVTTAANCCRHLNPEHFATVRDVMPILLNVLGCSDQKVLEQGCYCVSRIVTSFNKAEQLEQLITKEMLKAILNLLLPGTTNLVGPKIHTEFLRVLSHTAKNSPSLAVDMLQMNIVDTLYQILTGVSPPSEEELATTRNDSVVIMQALIHRPREHVYETLNVICELLPDLPRDDIQSSLLQLISSGIPDLSSDETHKKRLELLGGCKAELKRFAIILLPTLTDAYSSTVNLNVRQKVLSAQLKMISNLDTDILEEALNNVAFASYLASILSQQDNPTLVLAAIQASELLLRRLPDIYRYHFHREGVISEISKLATKKESESEKSHAINEQAAEDNDDRNSEASHGSEDHLTSSPVSSRSSSSSRHLPINPTTAMNAWIAARAAKFMESHDKDESGNIKHKAGDILEDLKALAEDMRSTDDYYGVFDRLVKHFESNNSLTSISSFELLNSNIVDALLAALGTNGETQNADARRAFLEVFLISDGSSEQSPFSILVSKLQDLLSRSEHFEVVTVHQNSYDGNRSSAASMLAKQLRLKLVADEDSEIPRPYRNIMVSIHAIATFKALDDYLRPRITISDRPKSSRKFPGASGAGGLSTAFAAFAAAANFAGQATSSPARNTAAGEGTSSAPAKSTRSSTRRKTKASKSVAEGSSATPKSPTKEASPRSPSGQEQLECMDERAVTDDDEMDEMDAVLDDLDREMDGDSPEPGTSPVNMEVAGGKVTARKEDGTRVATPQQNTPARVGGPSAAAPPASSSKAMSYAQAINAPQDWHIEFSIGDHVISNDTTIYRAVQMSRTDADGEPNFRNVWSSVHPIKFRRAPGPAQPEGALSPTPDPVVMTSGVPASLDKNKVSSSILHLLSILHALNTNLEDVFAGDQEKSSLLQTQPLSQFVNTKLTAKLNRQLEEPLIVASACLPSWSEDLARFYPFLFPFETRHLFLQSTSFGYSRSMTRWQNAQSTSDSRHDRRDDNRPFLGRLQRQKVRISRVRILESAIKVMELYGASPSVLEVEYFEEVGTGLGPTLEFYSSVSREFSKKKLKLWRENNTDSTSEYAFGEQGLFPAPMTAQMAESENGKKVLHLFKMLGKFVARSMLDSRIIDISFNPTFFRTGEGNSAVVPSLGAVKTVDKSLANSLKLLRKFAIMKKKLDDTRMLSAAERKKRIAAIEVDGVKVEDMALDFTLPGYPHIELEKNGANLPVTIYNVGRYVDAVINLTLGSGVQRQVEAFKTGFSQVFPYSALRAFTPDELVMLFGRIEEDWSIETLTDSIRADHGFNMDSKSVKNLLQVMSELSPTEHREFLQFVTGSPKLPIGGFKALTPLFTVVCKPSEPPLTSDDYLPSVMTCVNYLKLPDYSSLEVLRSRLKVAIKEGQGAFHLS